MGSERQGTRWFAVSIVMVVMVFVIVLGPLRSSGVRAVDILLLFFGGFAAGASFVRGVMLRRQG